MQHQHRTIPELLAPAGSFEKLVTAVHYGADAVYLGGRRYSLRARAANFDTDGIRAAAAYAHEHGVKVYVTVNIFAHNRDLENLDGYLLFLQDAGVDGLIISDPGIILTAQRLIPDLPVHLSTQANVTNLASVRFWTGQGVRRLNLARELSIREIRQIRAATGSKLEVFVHGALCISYSGRCMLSSYMTGRDANRGDCAHPCRYGYRLEEEKRPGEYFPVEEDDRGTYIFNSRDLCLLDKLPELVSAGVDSIKIEGRMKSVYYVGAVVRTYRAALDWIAGQKADSDTVADLVMPRRFLDEITRVGTRGSSTNFFNRPPDGADMLYNDMRIPQEYIPVGIVRRHDPLVIETRNVLATGDLVEYLGRNLRTIPCTVTGITDQNGTAIRRANPCSLIRLHTDPPLDEAAVNGLLRKKAPLPKG